MERVLRRQEELLAELEQAGGLALEGRARALLLDVGLEQERSTGPRPTCPAASASWRRWARA